MITSEEVPFLRQSLQHIKPESFQTYSHEANNRRKVDMVLIDGDSIRNALKSLLTLRIPSKQADCRSSSIMQPGSRTGHSTPSCVQLLPCPSLSELKETHKLPFAMALTFASDYFTPHEILTVSSTSRELHGLRTSFPYWNWMEMNDWDIDALIRRIDETKNPEGPSRSWLCIARSAIHKDEILDLYHALLDHKESHPKKRSEKLIRILVDIVTEHDRQNFRKLTALAQTLDMHCLQFLATVPAHDWETRHLKTLVMAAYINTQPIYPEIREELEKVVESLAFGDVSTSSAFQAAHVNFLYVYACIAYTDIPPLPLSSVSYDPPHMTLSSHSWPFPGLRQAVERYTTPLTMKGSYRKINGDESKMTIQFEPYGPVNKIQLPFVDKHQVELTATVTDDEGNPPWEMEGSVNWETGRGSLKSQKGVIYDLWTIPWGLVGEKLMGERHLGYFVLQWT